MSYTPFNKVKHKTVRTVATVLPKEVEQFVELAQHIKSEMEHERKPKLFPVKTLAEMLIISRKRSLEEDRPLPVNMSNQRRLACGLRCFSR